MSKLINLRDFGGKPTLSGGRVTAGRLFRSGHLAGLDAESLDRLHAMDFAEIVDLRYADERDEKRSPWPPAQFDRVIAHDGATGEDAPHLRIMKAAMAGSGSIDEAYIAFYSALPFDRWYRPLFATALARIAATDGHVLIHCTAGKDRTGTLVALLLDLLGVSRGEIVTDYLRSRDAPGLARLRDDVVRRLAETNEGRIDEARADALIGVKPDYILAALDSVAARCGSTEAYFAEAGVGAETLTTLRANLLDRPRAAID